MKHPHTGYVCTFSTHTHAYYILWKHNFTLWPVFLTSTHTHMHVRTEEKESVKIPEMRCHTWYPSSPWRCSSLQRTHGSCRWFPHRTLPCSLWDSSPSAKAGWKCTPTGGWSSCPASWFSRLTRCPSLHLPRPLHPMESRRTRGGRCRFGWRGRGRTSSSSISDGWKRRDSYRGGKPKAAIEEMSDVKNFL